MCPKWGVVVYYCGGTRCKKRKGQADVSVKVQNFVSVAPHVLAVAIYMRQMQSIQGKSKIRTVLTKLLTYHRIRTNHHHTMYKNTLNMCNR